MKTAFPVLSETVLLKTLSESLFSLDLQNIPDEQYVY